MWVWSMLSIFQAAYVNQHVALISCREMTKLFLDFSHYMLAAGKWERRRSTGPILGGTKQGLGLDDIKSLIVALPPLDEQRAIITEA